MGQGLFAALTLMGGLLVLAGAFWVPLGLFLAGALAWWQSRRIETMVSALKRFAEQVAQGQPSQFDGRELGLIAEAQRALEAAVSELRRQNEARQAESSLLAAAVNSMPTGVLLLDAQDRLAFANPAAELFLQSGPLRSGQFYWEAFRQAEVLEAIKANAGKESPLTQEFRVSQGVERHLVMTLAPWNGPPGHGGTLIIFYDLSETKKLERMRSEFASNVSHELRTPLAAIKATLETLADGAIDDKAVNRDFVDKAARQAQRLEELINDLLHLASAEESRRLGRVDRSTRVKVPEALTQALQASEAVLRRLGAKVILSGPDLEAYCDPVALRQVLSNLLENAAKYGGAAPEIEVQTRQEGGHALLEVRDFGPGIPEADHARVFERFYRVQKSRVRSQGDEGGSGLGLAIVKHLIENHGGQVTLEDARPGCRFVVRLPLVTQLTSK